MAKVINQYRAVPLEYFTPTNIKNRSSNVGDESVNGTNLDVINITSADMRNAIGESHNKIGALWHSANVNKYSKFGPYTRLVLSGELQFITPVASSPAHMGDFAGYNNLAIKPEVEGINWSPGGSYQVVVCSGETAYFTPSFYVNLGEIDWGELKTTASYMNVQFTNSDMSVLYATSSNFTLNTSTFTKYDNNLRLSSSKTLSSTTTLVRTYYLSYHFFDSSNNELIFTGANERPSFSVTYSFRSYGVDAFLIEPNTKFDAISYTSYTFNVTQTTAVLTFFDFKTIENGSCTNEIIQIYVAYPDSTTWEKYSCESDYSCSGGSDMILNLDDNRVSCTQNMKIKLWPKNILDCPLTRPF